MYQIMYIDIGTIKKIKTTRPNYTVRFTTVERLVINMDFDLETAEQYFERGKNRIIFEKYSDAIEDLTKAIELYPGDEIYSEILFMAHYARGFAYKKLKKYIDAMQDFEKAMTYECDPDVSWHNHYICEQILFGYDDFVRWDVEAQKAFEFVFDEDETTNHIE